jgi:hypothetical protein
MKRTSIRIKEALVVQIVRQYPELSDAEVANLAGCARTSLYRMQGFRTARAFLKAQGKANLPRGYKVRDGAENDDVGTLEAWDEEPLEENGENE